MISSIFYVAVALTFTNAHVLVHDGPNNWNAVYDGLGSKDSHIGKILPKGQRINIQLPMIESFQGLGQEQNVFGGSAAGSAIDEEPKDLESSYIRLIEGLASWKASQDLNNYEQLGNLFEQAEALERAQTVQNAQQEMNEESDNDSDYPNINQS